MTELLKENKDSGDIELTYDVNESFPMQMIICVKLMRESLTDLFSDAGYSITTEQWIILTYLAERDGVTQHYIAQKYDKSEVSVLNLLKKLENINLIIRRRDPVDGRCNRVYLTAEGRKIHQKLIPIAKGNIARMSKGISEEALDLLKETTRKITSNLRN